MLFVCFTMFIVLKHFKAHSAVKPMQGSATLLHKFPQVLGIKWNSMFKYKQTSIKTLYEMPVI